MAIRAGAVIRWYMVDKEIVLSLLPSSLPPNVARCVACDCDLTVENILIECGDCRI